MRWLVVIALAGALAPAAHAQTTSRTGEAIRIATFKWGVPCGGDVTYTWDTTTAPNAGEASWRYFPPDPGPIGWTGCRVVIDKTRAQQWRDKQFAWYCTLFTHEVGHLAGVPHSENPRSIMAPVITALYVRCVDAGRARGWQ